MFRYLKHRKALKAKANILYNESVMQARLPVFYKDLGVPDSIDGRFEMTALHCYIIIYRLNKAGQAALSQALFDAFFTHMNHSLREAGVGDVGVPKHMKRMMQGFNGRCQSYEIALKSGDKYMLKDALLRNVYGTAESTDEGAVSILIDYVMRSASMEVADAEFAAINIQDQDNQEFSHA